ncbi:J domain-containing protein [Pedobacter aquatilis]|uniref:J domain-containing protein n=1 Tax=Pedobacter aquatilis TaxID=351343 RepID=UPI00293080BF|nr:J domain-containing protein [Pedobacter aquatilis]
MKWFSSCSSLDQVKALYKKLAKEHHPDFGGDTATMQEINSEYAFASAGVIRSVGFAEEEMEQEIRYSEVYRQAIEAVVNLDGLLVELVGNWIWVTGNTRLHREMLKSAGYRFSAKKLAWYFRSEVFSVRKSSGKSLEEIKAKYGSEPVNHPGRKAKPFLNV